METNKRQLLFRYRLALGAFIIGLVLSGISAFPLRKELSILSRIFAVSDSAGMQGLRHWITLVDSGMRETYARFPFFGYGTDWLGFGHFVIAMFFILPLIDPVRYRAVLYLGVVACAGVLLVAFICGPIRGIPFFWTLIDCSFGIVGAVPLLYCLHLIPKIQQ